MARQIINGPKILLMKVLNKKNISFVVALIASMHLYAIEPIAYLNSLGYEPAQKEIASSKNGMITTQHFWLLKLERKF